MAHRARSREDPTGTSNSMKNTVWVGRVKSTVPPNTLREAFSKCGNVTAVDTGFAGFAFVEYETEEDCVEAVKKMNNAKIANVGQIHVTHATLRGYDDALKKRDDYWRSRGGMPSNVSERIQGPRPRSRQRSRSRSFSRCRRRDSRSRSRSRSADRRRQSSASSSASSSRFRRRKRAPSSSAGSAKSRERSRSANLNDERNQRSMSKSSRRQSSERSKRTTSRKSRRSRSPGANSGTSGGDETAKSGQVETSTGPDCEGALKVKPPTDAISLPATSSISCSGGMKRGVDIELAMQRPPLRQPLKQPLRPSPRPQHNVAATTAATAAAMAMSLMKTKNSAVATTGVRSMPQPTNNVGLQLGVSEGASRAAQEVLVPELSRADRRAALCFFDGAGAYDLLLESSAVLRAATADCLNGFPHAYEGLSQEDAADVLNVIAGFVSRGGVKANRGALAVKPHAERSVEVRQTLTLDALGGRMFRKSIVVDGVVRFSEQSPVGGVP